MQHFSPYAAFQELAARQPEHQAIVFDDLSISYGEFAERVGACAGWLLRESFVPGEVAGICIRGEVSHLVVSMALLWLDTPQISLGSHESGTTKRALADKVGLTQLIAERQESWMDGLRTIVLPSAGSSAMRASFAGLPGNACRGRTINSVAVYQNTSGSTNVPKTFGFSLERLLILAKRYAGDAKERRTLRTGSIEFDASRLHRLGLLFAGNSNLFLRHLSLRGLIEFCGRAEATAVHMGGYKLGALVRSEAAVERLPSDTTVHTGGARVPGHLRQDIKRVLTDNLYVLYATSEVGFDFVRNARSTRALPGRRGISRCQRKFGDCRTRGRAGGPGRDRSDPRAQGRRAQRICCRTRDYLQFPRRLVLSARPRLLAGGRAPHLPWARGRRDDPQRH